MRKLFWFSEHGQCLGTIYALEKPVVFIVIFNFLISICSLIMRQRVAKVKIIMRMSHQYGSVSATVFGTSLCSIIFVLLTITYTSSKLSAEHAQGIHAFSHTILLSFGVISLLLIWCKVCNKIDDESEANTEDRHLWNSDPLEMVFLWLFAIGYIIETILYLLITLSNANMENKSVLWIAKITWDILLIFFLILQTLLFSLSRKQNLNVMERKLRYGLTLTAVCNVAQCFHAMLNESRTTTDTFNTAHNETKNIIFEHWLKNVQPYITPMKIEFNIMSLSFIFPLLKNLNKHNDSNEFRIQTLYEDSHDTFSETYPILMTRHTQTERVKSVPVLIFVGLLPTLPLIALEIYISNKFSIAETDTVFILFEFIKMANQCVDVLLCITGLCCLVHVQQSNNFRRKSSRVGDFILIFCCLGVQMYHVFGGFGVAMNTSSWIQHVEIAYHSMGFFGAMLQTVFIIKSTHLSSPQQRRSSLHRKVLVILGIVNFVFWLCDSFFVRHVYKLGIPESKYFGKDYWDVVCDLFLPLAIYYRFHSAVECYKVNKHLRVS